MSSSGAEQVGRTGKQRVKLTGRVSGFRSLQLHSVSLSFLSVDDAMLPSVNTVVGSRFFFFFNLFIYFFFFLENRPYDEGVCQS